MFKNIVLVFESDKAQSIRKAEYILAETEKILK
jgi:hypothetical protein